MTEHLTRFVHDVHLPLLIDFPDFKISDSPAFIRLQTIAKALLGTLKGEKNLIYSFESAVNKDRSVQAFVSPIELPSLAGLLLSYPAIYRATQPNATATGQDLDVYSVAADAFRRRILMQFSAPSEFRADVERKLEALVDEWETRRSQMPKSLSQIWQDYIGGGEVSTLKIQKEIRRVPIMSL